MRRVVYADSLVIMNTVVTYILLLSVRSFGRIRTAALRLVAAAFLGGVASLLVLVPPLSLYVSLLIKIALCSVISFLAFFVKDFRKFIRSLSLFALMTFLYGGVMFFLSYACSGFFLYRNGFGYVGMRFPGLIISVSALYLILILIKRKLCKNSERFIYEITLYYCNRTAKGKALFDSGHFVSDCYNGQPVIIVKESILHRLLTEPEFAELKEMNRLIDQSHAGIVKARLIPVSTVSGEHLLPAFTCDKVTVSGQDTFITVNSVTVALANLPDGAEGCDALINERLFEGR